MKSCHDIQKLNEKQTLFNILRNTSILIMFKIHGIAFRTFKKFKAVYRYYR